MKLSPKDNISHFLKNWLLNVLIILSFFLFVATLVLNPGYSIPALSIKESPTPVLVSTSIPKVNSTNLPTIRQTISPPSKTLTPSPELTRTETPRQLSTITTSPEIIPTLTIEPSKEVSFNQSLKVHFIDVGQGDSIIIESPDGKSILIDGGDNNSMVLNYLKEIGIKKLDLIIATHPHADHIGGIIEILNSFPTTKVITNGELYTTLTFESFLDAIANAKSEYSEVAQGDEIQIGMLTFSVLSPNYLSETNFNNNSLVLRLSYNDVSFLFMGDAELEVEKNLINSGITLKSDILKIGHHGSSTSSTSVFLNKVSPSIAIYSAGIGNSYGHPDLLVIKSLISQGIKLFGTDVNGTITISTDGKSYSIETTKSSEPVLIP